MTPATTSKLRLVVVLLVAVVVQTTLASDVRVIGVAPDLMLLVAICAGLVAGAEVGCILGFLAGSSADAFLTATPFGLSALTYCLIGFGVGVLRNNVMRDSWLLAPIVTFVATVAAVVGFVAFGDVVGQTGPSAAGSSWVIRVALVEGVWAAALSIAVHPLVARAARGLVAVERLDGRPDRLPAR
ncbi:MAG: rod shape-determining protein MreD [Actinomycetota bacterium]|nr:rod shape-determining protein MreD [Actinomycetota bacterium]